MSTTIDQRAVEMKFDNAQFEKGVSQTIDSVGQLKKSLDFSSVGNSMGNITKSAQNVNLTGISTQVQNVSLAFEILGNYVANILTGITNNAVMYGKKIFTALAIQPAQMGFQEYETQINSVQTILANTQKEGANLQQVTAALDELNLYADRTIYNFTEMTRNIGTFTAAGVELDTSVQAIKGIANLAAVSGSNAQQASTAMYQLSQALASGTIRLMDWNSVVNAGMGGQVFQDALMETARVHGIAIDQMVENDGSFRETLQNGWLSAEIMTETLAKFTGDLSEAQLEQMGYNEEQIVQIMELGEMANDAATKVKTFTQLIDTLKEAAQSGWAQSWRTIIGDFEESKALFTEISDTLGGIINESSNARNEMLLGGLASGWKQFLGEGIADEAGYIDSITSVAESHGIVVEDLIEEYGSFQDSLQSGWLTADIMAESISHLAEQTRGLSDDQLEEMGYTRDQIDALEALETSVNDGSFALDSFASNMDMVSGRQNIIDGLWNAFDGLMSVVTPIREAFLEIFPPITGEQLYQFTELVKELSASLILSEETADKLGRTFKGIFAVFDIVRIVFVELISAILPAFSHVSDFSGSILDVTANMGDWLVELRDTIKTTNIFGEIMEKIGDFVSFASDKIKEFLGYLKSKISIDVWESLSSVFDGLHERISATGDVAATFGSVVTWAIQTIAGLLENNNLIQIFYGVYEFIKNIADSILTLIGGLISGMFEVISEADFSQIFDFINSASLGAIALAISSFFTGWGSSLNSFLSRIAGAVEEAGGIKGLLNDVRSALETWQNSIKAKTLQTIAISVGILVASLWVLASIDSRKLAEATATITILFAELMGAMAVFTHISKDVTGLMRMVPALILLSVSIFILAGALKLISSLNPQEMITGLVGIGAMMKMLLMTVQGFSANGKLVIKAASQLVLFAIAIKILASALKDIAVLNIEELITGLIGIGSLMYMMQTFANGLDIGKGLVEAAISMVIIGVAMKVLASAIGDMAQYDWEELAKGLAAIGIFLLEFSLMAKILSKSQASLISAGISIVIISGSMIVLALALERLAPIPLEQLATSMGAVAIGLALMTASLRLMPNGADVISSALSLAILSGSLWIVSQVLVILGGMEWAALEQGLVAVGVSLAMFAIGLHAMSGTMSGSLSLLVAAGAMAILAPVIYLLGTMDIASVAIALGSLAAVFVILGIAGIVLLKAVPGLMAFAAAVALIGLGVALLGVGLIAAGAGLSAIALGITAVILAVSGGVSTIVAALTAIVLGIFNLIPEIVEAVGHLITGILDVVIMAVPQIAETIKEILLAVIDLLVVVVPNLAEGLFTIIVQVIRLLGTYVPQLVEALLQLIVNIIDTLATMVPRLLGSLLNLILEIFSGITEILRQLGPEIILDALKGVGALLVFLAALNLIYVMAPGALLGILAFGVLVGVLTGVLVAIGAIAQIPGLQWIVSEGADFLGSIGGAIGAFLGGIAGGVVAGVSSQLPQLGSDLSSFIQNAKLFIDTASSLDSSIFTGTASLVGAVLAITAANVINNLASWLTGGASFVDFGKELAEFGPYFKQYADSIDGIDPGVIEGSANAAKALAEMALALPNTGGLVAAFTGDNSLAAFAEELIPFGRAMKEYDSAITGISPEVITASATAALALVEMAQNIPNTGGLVAAFTGENSMVAFAQELVPFGRSMKQYDTAISGISPEAITASATAALSLAELAQELPNMGGLVSFFTGDNDMGVFGDQLTIFGGGLKDYDAAITGITPEAITGSATAAAALIELAQDLPNMGGLVSFFTGDNDMGVFGEQLTKFGQGMKDYDTAVLGITPESINASVEAAKKLIELGEGIPANAAWYEAETGLPAFGTALATFAPRLSTYYMAIADINTAKLSSVTDEVGELVDMAKGMVGLNTGLMGNFGEALTELGNSGIDGFISAFEGSMGEVKAVADEMITTFITAVENKRSNLTRSFTQLLEASLTAIRNKNNSFRTAGSTLITNFLSGITSKTTTVNQTITDLGNTMIELLNSKQGLFRTAGSNIMNGFVAGLNESATSANQTITNLGNTMSDLLNSKYGLFRQSGKYLVEGFAQGISDNTFLAETRAIDMANAAANAAKKTLDERSPSRVGYGIGNFFGVGFVNGISELTSDYISAGQNMANDARKGLSGFVTQIAESIEDGLDLNPVITPVLDLTNFNNASRSLGSLLAVESVENLNASISGNRNTTQTTSAPIQQTNITMNQTNNSPKALSRIDIYRNTRNQISKVKDMVNK